MPPLLTYDAKDASSLLQVIIFFLAWVGCWLPVATLIAIAIKLRPPIGPQKLPLLGSLYLIALPVLWGASWVTGTSFSDYGFAWSSLTLYSFGLGFACGVLGLGVLFGIQTALGWVTWQSGDGRRLPTLLLTLLLAVWIGGTEELIFRGFLVTQLQQDYSLAVTAVISSLIFALLHLVWEQRETVPQLPGLWLMGMVLVLARHVNGDNLGLAWGLHAGWVWAIASLDSAQMIVYTGTGSQWVTGLAGKPLAGAVGIVCLVTTGGILWLFSPV